MLQNRAQFGDPKLRHKLFWEAVRYNDKARSLNPAYTSLWNQRALLHFVAYPDIDPQGREVAIELLHETINFNPVMMDARLGLAHIYQTMGEDKKALKILEESLGWPVPLNMSSINMYNQIAAIKLRMGDKEGHARALNQSRAFAARHLK